MDENKICFISCVTNDEQYNESVLFLKNLNLPEDMQAEFLSVRGAASMTGGYNQAMRASDAKYKVYLHQDVFVIEKNAIINCIKFFKNNSDYGLLGLAGCCKLPDSGKWWKAQECTGLMAHSFLDEEVSVKLYGKMETDHQAVEAVDGVFMMTQYDLPWRADLFTGWHFYDISQSMEFRRAGYKVAVLRQEKPWCIHETEEKSLGDYNIWRKKFLQEYGQELNFEA